MTNCPAPVSRFSVPPILVEQTAHIIHCPSNAERIAYLSIKSEGPYRTCSSAQEEQEGQSEAADYTGAAGITPALEHVGAHEPCTPASLAHAIDYSTAIRIYFDMEYFLYVGENPLEQARILAVDDAGRSAPHSAHSSR